MYFYCWFLTKLLKIVLPYWYLKGMIGRILPIAVLCSYLDIKYSDYINPGSFICDGLILHCIRTIGIDKTLTAHRWKYNYKLITNMYCNAVPCQIQIHFHSCFLQNKNLNWRFPLSVSLALLFIYNVVFNQVEHQKTSLYKNFEEEQEETIILFIFTYKVLPVC